MDVIYELVVPGMVRVVLVIGLVVMIVTAFGVFIVAV